MAGKGLRTEARTGNPIAGTAAASALAAVFGASPPFGAQQASSGWVSVAGAAGASFAIKTSLSEGI